MTHVLGNLPPWAALLIAVLVFMGALVTFIGTLGLLRLGNFYERVHAPTLGTTLGVAFTIIASMICFSILHTRFVVHEILIGIFAFVTTPVTLILLVRAALYREHRAQSWGENEDDQPRDAGDDILDENDPENASETSAQL